MSIVATYSTEDGRTFSTYERAAEWQSSRRAAEKATRLFLETDLCLYAALVISGGILGEWTGDDRRDLTQINRHTVLAIPHWQCRDQAGYRVCAIRPCGQVFVYGDAGSWSGPYGCDVWPVELLRYFRGTPAEQRFRRAVA